MHPAPSIILFSTLSGLGFGLLAMLGLNVTDPRGWTAAAFWALGGGLAVAGLVASTFHLGHPERALKAFTQWRSSWLSREAWLAVAALTLSALAGALDTFGSGAPLWLGVPAALLCLATVFATSMIYAQLRTVPRWHSPTVPALFVGYALTGGLLLAGRVDPAIIALALMFGFQTVEWRLADTRRAAAGTDAGTATRLGERGAVRLFEAPHTGPNYLTREMVFVVARKHALTLRILAAALAFLLPVLALLWLPGHIGAGLAVVSHLAGVLCQRWLFFAEAEHVVASYYGR